MNHQPSGPYGTPVATHYAFGSFTYDAKRAKLQCYGVDIPLKPKTGALLHYFLQHPHRVITKSELLDTLWRDEDVVEANLAQHVFLLRQAFATYSPGETFIVTTARQGYCFVAAVQTAAHARPSRGTSWKSYVEGRFFLDDRTQPSLERAIEAFERTVAEDNAHAGAHAGIAEANVLAAEHLFAKPLPAFTRARAEAQRALELDPDNVEAYIALGNIHLFHDWDFVAAYEAFERATWLDPSHASSRLHKARFLAIVGNYEAAASEIESVLAREPSSLKAITEYAAAALLHEDFNAVYEMTDAALSLDPSDPRANYYRIAALAFSGRYEEALRHTCDDHGYEQQFLAVTAFAAGRAGLRNRAGELTAKIDAEAHWPYVSPFHRALPRIGLDDTQTAYRIVESGIHQRDPLSVFILRHPAFQRVPGIDELRHAIGPQQRNHQ